MKHLHTITAVLMLAASCDRHRHGPSPAPQADTVIWRFCDHNQYKPPSHKQYEQYDRFSSSQVDEYLEGHRAGWEAMANRIIWVRKSNRVTDEGNWIDCGKGEAPWDYGYVDGQIAAGTQAEELYLDANCRK